MNRYKIIALTLAIVFLTIPVTNSQVIDTADVKAFQIVNCMLSNMDYNSTTKVLSFYARPRSDSTISIGLGMFILKFAVERAPDYQDVQAHINGQPTEDMLKNFTFTDGEYIDWSVPFDQRTEDDIHPCKYLKVYFYVFENHSIINEQPLPYTLKPEYDPESLPASEEPLMTDDKEIVIRIGNFGSITPVVVGATIIVAVVVLVALVKHGRIGR